MTTQDPIQKSDDEIGISISDIPKNDQNDNSEGVFSDQELQQLLDGASNDASPQNNQDQDQLNDQQEKSIDKNISDDGIGLPSFFESDNFGQSGAQESQQNMENPENEDQENQPTQNDDQIMDDIEKQIMGGEEDENQPTQNDDQIIDDFEKQIMGGEEDENQNEIDLLNQINDIDNDQPVDENNDEHISGQNEEETNEIEQINTENDNQNTVNALSDNADIENVQSNDGIDNIDDINAAENENTTNTLQEDENAEEEENIEASNEENQNDQNESEKVDYQDFYQRNDDCAKRHFYPKKMIGKRKELERTIVYKEPPSYEEAEKQPIPCVSKETNALYESGIKESPKPQKIAPIPSLIHDSSSQLALEKFDRIIGMMVDDKSELSNVRVKYILRKFYIRDPKTVSEILKSLLNNTNEEEETKNEAETNEEEETKNEEPVHQETKQTKTTNKGKKKMQQKKKEEPVEEEEEPEDPNQTYSPDALKNFLRKAVATPSKNDSALMKKVRPTIKGAMASMKQPFSSPLTQKQRKETKFDETIRVKSPKRESEFGSPTKQNTKSQSGKNSSRPSQSNSPKSNKAASPKPSKSNSHKPNKTAPPRSSQPSSPQSMKSDLQSSPR